MLIKNDFEYLSVLSCICNPAIYAAKTWCEGRGQLLKGCGQPFKMTIKVKGHVVINLHRNMFHKSKVTQSHTGSIRGQVTCLDA